MNHRYTTIQRFIELAYGESAALLGEVYLGCPTRLCIGRGERI